MLAEIAISTEVLNTELVSLMAKVGKRIKKPLLAPGENERRQLEEAVRRFDSRDELTSTEALMRNMYQALAQMDRKRDDILRSNMKALIANAVVVMAEIGYDPGTQLVSDQFITRQHSLKKSLEDMTHVSEKLAEENTQLNGEIEARVTERVAEMAAIIQDKEYFENEDAWKYEFEKLAKESDVLTEQVAQLQLDKEELQRKLNESNAALEAVNTTVATVSTAVEAAKQSVITQVTRYLQTI